METTYLGDSVYLDYNEFTGEFKIYTNNGLGPENVIYLDRDVIQHFIHYIVNLDYKLKKKELEK